MNGTGTPPRPTAAPVAVGVVVPAFQEEGRIAACVRALLATALPHGVRRTVVVVADACSDATVERAAAALRGHDGAVVETADRNVGAARAAGFAHVISLLGVDRTWLATTDADTLVPPSWLTRQLAAATRGWHAVAGTVEVGDWSHRSVATREAFLRLQRSRGLGDGHPHVHGANLGFSARAYLEAGGMPALPSAEDRALWDGLAATGRPLLRDGGLVVRTSGRRSDRTADGFSALLDRLGA